MSVDPTTLTHDELRAALVSAARQQIATGVRTPELPALINEAKRRGVLGLLDFIDIALEAATGQSVLGLFKN
jgi:hypothetical protein